MKLTNTINMKKSLFILGAALIMVAVPSCTKKGENDPFLSFMSRDARITGKWKLSAYEDESTTTTVAGGTTFINTSTSNYDGTNMTDTWTSWGGGTNIYTYAREITINKDGTYNLKEVVDGDTQESTGYWWWIDDKKKKTRIAFDDDANSMDIDQLKNKEMILINNWSNKDIDSNGDSDETVYSSKGTYTKEK